MHLRSLVQSGILRAFTILLGIAGTMAVFAVVPLLTMNFTADTPQTYTVTNTNNSGPGSLRLAITNANSHAGGDRIEFTVSGTITLATGLPVITDVQGVTIDGTTAPDSLNGPDIIIDGASIDGAGLFLNSDENTVLGLKMTNFGAEGIRITGANNKVGGTGVRDRVVLLSNGRICCSAQLSVLGGSTATKIRGNYIGVDSDGTTVGGNGGATILINGNSNNTVIGGTNTAQRNVIAGGTTANISVVAGANTIIQQNYIGVTSDATAGAGTTQAGIVLTDNADGTRIFQNVISNHTAGAIQSGGADNLTIQGNFIGVNGTGTAAIPNADGGTGSIIDILDSTSFTIGGADLSDTTTRNIISGNTGGPGKTISIEGTSDGVVQGNYIGLNASGDTALANELAAIGLTQSGAVTISNNVISGNTDVRGVLISSTGIVTVDSNLIGVTANGVTALANKTGVYVTTPNHTITSNLISGNTNFGVVLATGANGVTLYNNKIGVNTTVTAAVPNGTGIDIQAGVSGTIIGGTGDSQANIIGGNTTNGISVAGTSTTIKNNFIGTLANGTTNLGNGAAGIIVRDNSTTTTLGGPNSNERNVIAFNVDGVKLESLADLFQMRRNRIYSNTGSDVVYLSGANGGLLGSTITITSATSSRVIGTSTLGEGATIEVFTDSIGSGMHTYKGSTTVNSDGSYAFHENLGSGTITLLGTTTAGRTTPPRGGLSITPDVSSPTTPTVTSSTAATKDASYTFLGGKEAYSSILYVQGGNPKIVGVPLDSNTNWNMPVTLSEGVNRFIFSSKDYSVNESPTHDVSIILDTIAPSVPTITSPTTVYDALFSIKGNRDANTAVLLGDGTVAVASAPYTAWSYTVRLSQGNNTFRFKTQDIAGNESALVTYTVFLPPPPNGGGSGGSGGKGPKNPPPGNGGKGDGQTPANPSPAQPQNNGTGGTLSPPPAGSNTGGTQNQGGKGGNGQPPKNPAQNPVKNPQPSSDANTAASPTTSTDTTENTTDAGGGIATDTASVIPAIVDDTGTLVSTVTVPEVITAVETAREIVDAVTTSGGGSSSSSTGGGSAGSSDSTDSASVVPDWWTESYRIDSTEGTLTDDPDQDGVTTAEEYAQGTDPAIADTDGDGISDSVEIVAGTNPRSIDSDNDGLTDYAEYINNTDPYNSDTDGDGYTDGEEAGSHQSDPTNKLSTPVDRNRDGFIDRYTGAHDGTTDSDQDGLSDLLEYELHTDPFNTDSDDDGVSDGREILLYGSNPRSSHNTSTTVVSNWHSDDISSTSTPFIVGAAPAGTVIEIVFVKDGISQVVGTATVDEAGTFAAQIDQGLLDGDYYMFIRSKNSATGVVKSESYPMTITIAAETKTLPPITPLTIDGQNIIQSEPMRVSSARPSLTLQAPIGLKLHVYWQSFLLASVLLTDLDSVEITPSNDLEPGLHTVYIQAERESDHTKGPIETFEFIVESSADSATGSHNLLLVLIGIGICVVLILWMVYKLRKHTVIAAPSVPITAPDSSTVAANAPPAPTAASTDFLNEPPAS